jgi:hypothetical protein
LCLTKVIYTVHGPYIFFDLTKYQEGDI